MNDRLQISSAVPVRAWHFVGDTLRDGRPIPADGEWLVHTGKIQMCATGLHASRKPHQALEYAPGATLCLVECRDVRQEDSDKIVCAERKIVARMDATDLLFYYARMQALSVVHLWEPPDIVLDYLMTGDEKLRAAAWAAARDAARDAAWDAAWAAAGAAARDAARAAAWAAARDAARDAAWDAAWAAAWDAARDAARAAARDAARAAAWAAARDAARDDAAWDAARDAARAAAWDAAWAAARDAARDAANKDFDSLVHESFADFLK